MSVFPGAIPPTGSASPSSTLAAAGHTSLHNTEYNEINAIATKVGTGASTPTSGTVLRGSGAGTSGWAQVNLTSDVTGVLPQANGGTGGNAAILAVIYPIGCIYTEITGVNPGTTFGFGTWVSFGTGQTLVGVDAGQTEFNTVQKTGGEKTHTLTVAELASHTHVQNSHNHGINGGSGALITDGTAATAAGASWFKPTATTSPTDNATAVNQNTGSDTAHNNLQPYITVYFWRRTA